MQSQSQRALSFCYILQAPPQESAWHQNEKDKETKANWDAYHIKIFGDICKDEVLNGNKSGMCLTAKGYKNLEDKFFRKTGKMFTSKQFKNKWDSMKKEYTSWMELLSATGLGWYPKTKTIEADDGWWKKHIQNGNPEHSKFRTGSPTNLEQQDVMFRTAYVIGQLLAIPREDIGDDKDDPVIVVDDDVGVLPAANNKVKLEKRKVTSTMDVSSKEKENPFVQAYSRSMSEYIARKTESSSCTKPDIVPSMNEVLGLIRECGVKERTSLFYTACKLAMSREHRELFAAFETNEGRLDWLHRAHNDMSK